MKLENKEIKQILINVAQYLNDNYNKLHPEDVVVYSYTDKVVFTCWSCGAIVYIDGGIYYISEDDGNWWVEESIILDMEYLHIKEVFGYKSSKTSIYYATQIAQALVKLSAYIEDNGMYIP